jgi:hypothetical protein
LDLREKFKRKREREMSIIPEPDWGRPVPGIPDEEIYDDDELDDDDDWEDEEFYELEEDDDDEWI